MARKRKSTGGGLSREQRLAVEAVRRMMATPAGRRGLLVLLVVGVIALVGWWAWQRWQYRPRPTGPTVRVATWNLHKSGRDAFDVRKAVEIIRDSQFDVVAFQEVTREVEGSTRMTGNNIQRIVNELGPPWRLAPVSDLTGNSEQFAFIYHAGHVQLLGPPQFVAAPEAGVFDRRPYQATFRCNQFDFTLVSVHLFYGSGAAGDYEKRRREAESLASIAVNLAAAGPEKDIIVLGDFNEERAHPNLRYFEQRDWERLLGRDQTTNLSSTETFDNILIEPTYTHEWNGQAGVVRFDDALYPRQRERAAIELSDHRPAWADFVNNLPDDD